MSARPSQRRNYYIDKNFQTKFIIKFCLLVALGSLLIVALIYWMARNSTTVGIADGRVAVHSTAEYLLPLLLQTIFIEMVIVCLATVIMTMFISHKIAGPLHRFKITFEKLGEGDLGGSIKLRQGDQLHQVAATYNEAIEKINNKVRMLKASSSLDEIKNILKTFKT